MGAIIPLVPKMQQDGRAPSGELNAQSQPSRISFLVLRRTISPVMATPSVIGLNATSAINVATEVGSESAHNG